MGAAAIPRASGNPEKKKLVRRFAKDRSQKIRHLIQGAFLLLNAWLGVQFYLWVRYFEGGPAAWQVSRPAGAEGWLPIAGLMNLKYFVLTGHVPPVHPAAMYLFSGFLLMSLFLKKAFCSWLCPVGTFSESLAALGRRILRRMGMRDLHLPKAADIPLRGLKYVLLGFFVAIIGTMSAEELLGFMKSPYGLMADVKMLNFFREISLTAAIILALLVLLSLLIQNFWCRYLCPYGALLGLASLLSPVKIRRDTRTCIDCAKCAHACPSHLPVDKLVQIRSAECNACMACVAACPAQDALQLALPPRKAGFGEPRWYRRKVGPVAMTCLLAYIFFGIVLYARVTNHWRVDLPDHVYQYLVPRVEELSHGAM
ncbi:4Fe-4S binding protein [Acidobacteria bacterium AB60]|nr:4Fe-4S binding protein [Acidobacteria bacterium AB60]